MRRRAARLLARGAGVALVGLVVWLVGLDDEVTAADGTVLTGRIVARDADAVVLRTGRGEVTIADPARVEVGLLTAFSALDERPGVAVLGALLHLAAVCVTFLRWGVLLRGAELASPWGEVFRLAWVGQFSAAVLPGGIGSGDLVKAFYVARRHQGRRTRAVVTVFVDRVVGLFTLCAIAAIAVLFAPPGTRLATARNVVLVLLAFGGAGLAVLLSERVRGALRLPGLARRLPLQAVVAEAGDAVRIYGRRPGPVAAALALSLLNHALFLTAFYLYGRALGADLSAAGLLVAIPVAQILAAIPGLPGGWGVGDAAFLAFLPETGVAAGVAVALSFTYRVLHTLLALPGGLWLFRHRGEMPREGEARVG